MTDVMPPVPVRALNQVTYCPRLYYLQYVDCVMPTNEHVEAGLHDHRRVDDADLASRPAQGRRRRADAQHAAVFGIAGHHRRPRPHRREKQRPLPRRDEARQRTARRRRQADHLGQRRRPTLRPRRCSSKKPSPRPVAHGYQFYAGTRERVEVPFDDALRDKTRQAIALCRELSARDAPPEPLPAELRHRCFGCSLAPVCLPEETLYQIGVPAVLREPSRPASRASSRSPTTGPSCTSRSRASHVGKRSEHLVVRKDGRELSKVPMHAVRQVVICGNVQVSTQALETLAANDIPVVYLTGYGRFLGTFMPAMPKNVGLREAQFRLFADRAECLKLAKAVVRAKLTNQRALLMRSLRADGDRGSEEPAARAMAELLRKLDEADTPESLLGREGQGAALYFGEFGRFIKAQAAGPGLRLHRAQPPPAARPG